MLSHPEDEDKSWNNDDGATNTEKSAKCAGYETNEKAKENISHMFVILMLKV